MLNLNVERNIEVERSLESEEPSIISNNNTNEILDRKFFDDLATAEKYMDTYIFSAISLGWNLEDIKAEYFGVALEAIDNFVEAYKEYDKETVMKYCGGLLKSKQFKALLNL